MTRPFDPTVLDMQSMDDIKRHVGALRFQAWLHIFLADLRRCKKALLVAHSNGNEKAMADQVACLIDLMVHVGHPEAVAFCRPFSAYVYQPHWPSFDDVVLFERLCTEIEGVVLARHDRTDRTYAPAH